MQTMRDTSPTKWHLAHTTWFFETLILEKANANYKPVRPEFRFLFNSYYNTIGAQYPRPKRGLLTRPTLDEVFAYRNQVDESIRRLLGGGGMDAGPKMSGLIELGIQHEQQHQELILTDIKHLFSCNPLDPVYRRRAVDKPGEVTPLRWFAFEGGVCDVGFDGSDFAYDNERPRHHEYLEPFEIGSRPVSNGEFLAFIEDNGYERPEMWLSDGWNARCDASWSAPMYWRTVENNWFVMTLAGLQPLNLSEPVCHVSFFEADAFARWRGLVLPLEGAWEVAASTLSVEGNFVERGRLHPTVSVESTDKEPTQMFGDVWEWTASPYVPYPGYVAEKGALGEYNAKFMCNQMVLRGGSCVSPQEHLRPTYRNFFPPGARWQFTGIRLARLRK